jgi:hypothetical protein
MGKIIVGLLIGVGLFFGLLRGPFSEAVAGTGGDRPGLTQANIDSPDSASDRNNVFTRPIENAGNSITDNSTAGYYKSLSSGYNVDNSSSRSSPVILQPMPDIGGIYQSACSLPIAEAGKTVGDSDLSSFYKKLTGGSDPDVPPGSGK